MNITTDDKYCLCFKTSYRNIYKVVSPASRKIIYNVWKLYHFTDSITSDGKHDTTHSYIIRTPD